MSKNCGWHGWFDAISILLVWLLLGVACEGCIELATKNEKVYVCGNEYHARNCGSLKRCNDSIQIMKRHEARKEGIKPCYTCAR